LAKTIILKGSGEKAFCAGGDVAGKFDVYNVDNSFGDG
jgi:enoyl-CoA hydratase/carnithine racemase